MRSHKPSPSFIVFDLDGTILELSDVENSTYIDALQVASGGVFDVDWARYPVRTDVGVANQVIAEAYNGADIDAIMVSFKQDYLSRLERVLSSPHFVAAAVNGARETLSFLKSQEHCLIGLATANLRGAGEMRLYKAGLGSMFDVSSYAEDGRTKSEILAEAISKCHKVHAGLKSDRIVFVGDQVPDVIAARVCQVDFIGIARDQKKERILQEAGCTKTACDLRMNGPFGEHLLNVLR